MADIIKSFWKGKKVFLTGHTGFKGSWLSLWLHKMGAEVTGYALKPPTSPSLYDQADIGDLVDSNIGDIRDFENLKKVLIGAKPDIVIHMAAQALVRYSYKNPIETYMTNVMGTVHLLEAVRSVDSIRSVVNVTTDKCYENREWHWGYRENEPMGGFDPYSNSKGCSELVTSAYRRSFFSDSKSQVFLASARAGNVIGGGDWAEDRLIPDVFRAFLKNETVIVRSPRSIRPWQHVLEPLRGYLLLAQSLYEKGDRFAEAFNFGPDDSDAREVDWIVQKLAKMWGESASYKVVTDPSAVHEATHLKLDCSKAKACLEWSPNWGLEQALERIVAWNKAYAGGMSARGITLAQIGEYEMGLG